MEQIADLVGGIVSRQHLAIFGIVYSPLVCVQALTLAIIAKAVVHVHQPFALGSGQQLRPETNLSLLRLCTCDVCILLRIQTQ